MHPQERTVNKRELKQTLDADKAAALTGPVVITDEGSPCYVLMDYDRYLKLSNSADALTGDTHGEAASASEPGGTEHGTSSWNSEFNAEDFWIEESLQELAETQRVEVVESIDQLQHDTISDQEAEAFITALGL